MVALLINLNVYHIEFSKVRGSVISCTRLVLFNRHWSAVVSCFMWHFKEAAFKEMKSPGWWSPFFRYSFLKISGKLLDSPREVVIYWAYQAMCTTSLSYFSFSCNKKQASQEYAKSEVLHYREVCLTFLADSPALL